MLQSDKCARCFQSKDAMKHMICHELQSASPFPTPLLIIFEREANEHHKYYKVLIYSTLLTSSLTTTEDTFAISMYNITQPPYLSSSKSQSLLQQLYHGPVCVRLKHRLLAPPFRSIISITFGMVLLVRISVCAMTQKIQKARHKPLLDETW